MKNSLLLIIALILFVGCNANTAHQAVRDAFPQGEIVNIPGEVYYFIIRETNGTIYFVDYAGGAGSQKVAVHPVELLKAK